MDKHEVAEWARQRQNRQRILLLGGLSVVLVVLGLRAMSGQGASTAGAAPTQGAEAEQLLATLSTSIAPPRALVDWPVVQGRDLFRSDAVYPPAPEPKAAAPMAGGEITRPQALSVDELMQEAQAAISLRGTMLGQRPMAFINGGWRRSGEVVAGFRITHIEARQIVVERDGVRLLIQSAE